MILRRLMLILCLSVAGHFVTAQDHSALINQIKQIDSLIYFNSFELAEKKADYLYDSLSRVKVKSAIMDFQLTVMLHKSYIYSRKNQGEKALQILLDVKDLAKKYNLPEKEYQAYLQIATIYEISEDSVLSKHNLDKAFEMYQHHNLDSVFSVYCIRISSYYRFQQKTDSAIHYALNAFEFARKYNNPREYVDACLLLGILFSKKDVQKSAKFSSLAASIFLKKNDFEGTSAMYNNISNAYLEHHDLDRAFLYNDSAFWAVEKGALTEDYYSSRTRYKLFEAASNLDSAFFYLKKYHSKYVDNLNRMESTNIKKVTEQYKSEEQEAFIEGQKQKIFFVLVLLVVIAGGSVLLIRNNRIISRQNKIIKTQVNDLFKAIAQKQVLLSELQHRLKNNLQHVISILEIQKESVSFNNIEELIRGNQNRIHSMALLHKKLNVSENVNEVDLCHYVKELSALVKESYEQSLDKVTLEMICAVKEISIEKALPIGFILVELVSNSMKHAFRNQAQGKIHIDIMEDSNTKLKKLIYMDNGSGFNFDKTSQKGLGMEIIKGLIDQLDATVVSSSVNGFKLEICFK